MKLKGRSFLIAALVLFGGFTVYDYFRDEKKAADKMEADRLMTIDFQKVDQIESQKGDRKIVVKRSVDGWDLVEPLQDLADSNFADDFVKNIFPERILGIAKEGEDIDWALYGLDKPLGTILLKTTDGKQNFYEVSTKKNFEENAYLRRDKENRVLIATSVWQNRVEKSVADFRDRRFLRHKIASVDQFKIKNAQGTVELKRVDGKWQIAEQKKDFNLDQNRVRVMLSTIADAKASELMDVKAPRPPLKSLFTMDLVMADKKWTAQVGQAKDLGIYAEVSEPKFFMKMDPGALDKFIKMIPKDLTAEDKPKDTDVDASMDPQGNELKQKEKL